MSFKINLFLLIFSGLALSSNLNGQIIDLPTEERCVLLKLIINNDSIFSLPVLKWNYTDSITIFDRSGYFRSCVDQEGLNKSIGWKRQDLLPSPLFSNWNQYPEIRKKYNHYYVFESPVIQGNLITVIFIRLLSNHKGSITYRYSNGELELVDNMLIQY